MQVAPVDHDAVLAEITDSPGDTADEQPILPLTKVQRVPTAVRTVRHPPVSLTAAGLDPGQAGGKLRSPHCRVRSKVIGGAAWAEIRLSRITWGLGAESDAPEIATVPANSEARCTTLTRAVAYRIDWLVSTAALVILILPAAPAGARIFAFRTLRGFPWTSDDRSLAPHLPVSHTATAHL